MRYIILGSQGFIGTGISKYLKKKKVEIVKLTKISSDLYSDIRNNDVIINCFGKENRNDIIKNINKFINLLRIKKKNILWIQLSTPLIYNQQVSSSKISENTNEVPFNDYAKTKKIFDSYLKKKKNDNFHFLILRISTVYDKSMKSKVFKKIKFLNKFKLLPLINNKDTIINYLSLNELNQYIYQLSKKKKSWNNIFLISQNIKLVDLLETIKPEPNNYALSFLINKIFLKFINLFFLILKEKILFLKNKNVMQNNYVKKFIKIENKDLSNNKIKKFLRS